MFFRFASHSSYAKVNLLQIKINVCQSKSQFYQAKANTVFDKCHDKADAIRDHFCSKASEFSCKSGALNQHIGTGIQKCGTILSKTVEHFGSKLTGALDKLSHHHSCKAKDLEQEKAEIEKEEGHKEVTEDKGIPEDKDVVISEAPEDQSVEEGTEPDAPTEEEAEGEALIDDLTTEIIPETGDDEDDADIGSEMVFS